MSSDTLLPPALVPADTLLNPRIGVSGRTVNPQHYRPHSTNNPPLHKYPHSTNTPYFTNSNPSHPTKDFARPQFDGSLSFPPGSQLVACLIFCLLSPLLLAVKSFNTGLGHSESGSRTMDLGPGTASEGAQLWSISA